MRTVAAPIFPSRPDPSVQTVRPVMALVFVIAFALLLPMWTLTSIS